MIRLYSLVRYIVSRRTVDPPTRTNHKSRYHNSQLLSLLLSMALDFGSWYGQASMYSVATYSMCVSTELSPSHSNPLSQSVSKCDSDLWAYSLVALLGQTKFREAQQAAAASASHQRLLLIVLDRQGALTVAWCCDLISRTGVSDLFRSRIDWKIVCGINYK